MILWTILVLNMLHVENYPPMSPDINAIERVWGWMANYINHNYANNPNEYELLIQEAWDNIPQDVIDSYIFHVPKVLQEIREKKGDNSSS